MIEEINMDDILVDSTATHFGYLGSTNYTSYPMSHNPFVLNARGMRLNKMTTINLDGLG